MKILYTFIFICSSAIGFSQCGAGLSEVVITINTDAYGYEGYWELVPQGSVCGTGTIASGGNAAVGCNGAGLQNQTPGGYGNNLQVTSGPWCLTTGSQYSIIYIDDYGDGGFSFDVSVNGYQVESYAGIGNGGTYTFTVQDPLPYDLNVFSSNLYSYVTTGSYTLKAKIFNAGTVTMNSYNLNYSVNGGTAITHPVSGSTLSAYTNEEITHSIPLNIPTNGVYTIKVWTTNLNGANPDGDNSNDTLTKLVEAGPGRPNYLDGYVNTAFTISQIAGSSNQLNKPTDLDFHPVLTNKELWVVNKGTEATGSSTVTINNAGEAGQTSVYRQDGNAWHFMSLTTGLAFSQNGNFGTSPGVFDSNHDGGTAYTGPALWSSNMNIYAQPSGGNGSHLDMLHESPYCQGIAAESDNVFWVFDGYNNDIVRYDFGGDHGPGNDDHSDGVVRRYSDDAVAKDPANTIVSHLILDDYSQWLYVVDHGNNRVIRIDINTGSEGGAPSYPSNEALIEYTRYTGYTQETVVTGLDKPAGIDVIQNRMIVSEFTSGDIIIYDITTLPAVELERIATGKSSVQGIKIGPDGRIWFVDQNTNGVYRIETATLGITELLSDYSIYPNPTDNVITLQFNTFVQGEMVLSDINGKELNVYPVNSNAVHLSLDYSPGVYFVSIKSDGNSFETKRIVIK